MIKKTTLLIPGLLLLFLLTVNFCFAQDTIKEFTFDGCSSIAPEGTLNNPDLWCDCCLIHDISYWKGGTSIDRKNADKELEKCVAEKTGDKALGFLFYNGVRIGGSPHINTTYRWGFGWDFGWGYKKMTLKQEVEANLLLKSWYLKNPGKCSDKIEKSVQ